MRAANAWLPAAPTSRDSVLAEVLLHPLSLVCTLLWALNDHVWKEQYGNWLTGKLSDVCGLVVFPLLMFSLLQIASWATGRERNPSRRTFLWLIGATGATFAAINISEAADFSYRFIVGLLHIPEALLEAPVEAAHRVHHTRDPSDLLTLPALWVAYCIALPHARPRPSEANSTDRPPGEPSLPPL